MVNKDSLKDQKNRRRARTEVKKKFEERWACGLSLCGRGLLTSVCSFSTGTRLAKIAGSSRNYDSRVFV